MAVYASQMNSKGPFAQAAHPPMPSHPVPAGTFLPGTKVQVGSHRVVIDRYLSEGGFAHVYVVQLPQPVDGKQKAVLKRVAVPDKEHLANMRTEVDTMKRLRGHKFIVKYIDSHASQLKGGGYEVFLLMEFCEGGGLIDFMNTRLQNRLTEPEILKIFTDIAEGVACMHYLKPTLLHRDLKIENVLISTSGPSKIYKLCDFGSAAPPRPAATSAAEGRLIEDDIQRHTTLQYRSPEMIDVYRKHPIDEKSDIWALGVFLYKLCYYTTPFEEGGQGAILHAKFKFPGYPRFSDQLKLLIASMLREDPKDRPNIYQVLQKACQLEGRDLPLRDVYSSRTQSEIRKDQVLPQPPSSSQSRAGATLSPPQKEVVQSIPDIAPMRRGRPTQTSSHHGSAKPSPSPLRFVDSTDPFAALDGTKAASGDELSSRFPTLDQFSLMTDKGKNFTFEPLAEKKADSSDSDLAVRVTNALADGAFVRASSPPKPKPVAEKPPVAAKSSALLERQRTIEAKETQSSTSAPPIIPTKSSMVSVGTMTSTSPPKPAASFKPISERPIYQFTPHEPVSRSASTGNNPGAPRQSINTGKSGSRLASLLREDALRSQALEEDAKSPTSSRPSLEGGRPTMREIGSGVSRSRSLNLRNRPATVNLGARPTHINDVEIQDAEHSSNFVSAEPDSPDGVVESDTNITSDVEFLKAKEEEEKERRGLPHRRISSGSRHGKRSSLPSISLSGTKNLLSGRFGDAFKRFETNNEPSSPRERSISPSGDRINVLTPIAGSEATDLSDDRLGLEETEDLSPEMRRELEKRRLEAEEKRVERGAAEYRQRLAMRGGGQSGGSAPGIGRAATIQYKVRSLLKENNKPAQKTATGYGRFTDNAVEADTSEVQEIPPFQPQKLVSQRAPVHATVQEPKSISAPASAVNLPATEIRSQRPIAPPKPKVLRTGRSDAISSTPIAPVASEDKPLSPNDDWEANFNKRYPSLSGIEMVETEIDSPKTAQVRTREV